MKSKTFDQRVATKRDRFAVEKPDRAKRRKELIDQFAKGCDMVGSSLQELHDDRHWEDTHTSWVGFCREVLGISKTKAWKMLRYTEVVAGLSTQNQSKITNMEQALALLKVPEKDRDRVISKAENNGGITADNLRFHSAKPAVKKNVTTPVTHGSESEPSSSGNTESKPASKPPKPTKVVLYDEVGIPVPDDAIPYWNRRQEVQDILTQITKLKSVVVGGREAQDCQWLKVTNSIENTFDSLRSLISEAKPYAVCTTCQGVPSLQPEGCNFCKNTGLISRWQWDTQSRQEVKDIVMRRAADLKKERENVH